MRSSAGRELIHFRLDTVVPKEIASVITVYMSFRFVRHPQARVQSIHILSVSTSLKSVKCAYAPL